MDIRHITPILNVRDVAASLAWFEALGWTRCWTYNAAGFLAGAASADGNGKATFAAVGAGAFEIFLCASGQGARASLPPGTPEDDNYGAVWMTWWLASVDELERAHDAARAAGMRIMLPPENKPWGIREFHLAHPDGHVFRVSARPAAS